MLPSKSCVSTAASVIACTVLLQASLFAAEPIDPDSPSIRSYAASQERGNVRVTLLSVSRSISFLEAAEQRGNAPAFKAEPTVRIVCLLEQLNPGPLKSPEFGSIELTGPKGEPGLTEIPFRRENTMVIERSTRESIHDYNPNGTDYLPPVADPKRTLVITYWIHRATIKTGHLRLTLHAGFDGRREVFRFENVPVP